MEPISMILGLGLQLIGTGVGLSGSHDYNKAQKNSVDLQQKVEGQRQQAMELDARRREMEIVRTQQRARSVALSNATSQGAAQGSGLQGGYGQIAGQTGVNFLGVTQNLEIGQNIFGLNNLLSNEKIAMADAQQQMQLGQGISSLGGSIFGASKGLSNIFSGPTNSAPTPNYGQGNLGPLY